MAKIYSPATKAINPWDVDNQTGWTILGKESTPDERELVPVVADCVDELGKGLADLPFSIYDKNGKVVDDSDNYKNVTNAIPDPYAFLWLCGSSLAMSGAAYWRKKPNAAGYPKGLQYLAFPNVTAEIDEKTTPENLKFRRVGENAPVPAKDILYMWLPDPKVEFGPPGNYPLARAMKAAGSLSAISSFVDNYMNSGMVKAFIAQTEQPPRDEDEKNEIETYLSKFLLGVKNTLKKIRVINKAMTITTIGGGIDELKNIAIIKEIKQDVLEAFGVPASRVWGNAANYATAANDTLVFVTSEVMPLARTVQNAANEQLFKPYGYRLEFEPRRMEEFGVVVAEKIKSLTDVAKSFEGTLSKPRALRAAIDILGLDLSPEIADEIEKAIKEADAKPEPPVVMQALPSGEQPPPPAQTALPALPVNTRALVELDKWQAKSEKAGKLVTWHAVDLSPEIVEAVKGGLSWDDAREKLAGPRSDPDAILAALELAVRALENAQP